MSEEDIEINNNSHGGCSCFGCLVFIVSVILIIFIFTHLKEIWIFLEKLIK
jgi:hypothetical protein